MFVWKKGFRKRKKQNETDNKAWESLKSIIYMSDTVKKKIRSVSIFSSAMSCPFILLTLSLNVWMLVIFEGQFIVRFCVCVCVFMLLVSKSQNRFHIQWLRYLLCKSDLKYFFLFLQFCNVDIKNSIDLWFIMYPSIPMFIFMHIFESET